MIRHLNRSSRQNQSTWSEAGRVSVDGRVRTYTAVFPTSVGHPAALVLVLHGSNQSAKSVRRFSGNTFDAFAGDGGAVVAYLDGYKKNWNDARVSSNFPARREGVDDVAFTGAAIDLLTDRYRIDASRVYVIGFSAGGAMVIRLVHEIPSRLAGAAIISATQPVPDNFMLAGSAPHPLPIVLFHGTKDPLVPYDGGMASLWGFRPRGLGLSARQTAEYFARRNGIATGPRSHHLEGGPGSSKTGIERTDYRQAGHPPVTLYTVHGGGHTIPGSQRAPRIMGRSTQRLVAADAVGEFFGLYPKGSPND